MKQFALFQNHTELAHHLWSLHLKPGDCAIDATAGNGHDALFLAQLCLTHQAGALHCIDIQETALQKTRERLHAHLSPQVAERAQFHLGSHEHLPPSSPNLIVYNLGYLPGGNKEITTSLESTLLSLTCALKSIVPGGLISITCYPGHPEGAREEAQLLSFIATLAPADFHTFHYKTLNRQNAPSLITLSKKSFC